MSWQCWVHKTTKNKKSEIQDFVLNCVQTSPMIFLGIKRLLEGLFFGFLAKYKEQ